MNKIYKTALLVAASWIGVSVAQAGITPNDLYLGFVDSSSSSDYLINLGLNSSLIGGTSQINLSGDFSSSTYNSIFTSGTVEAGVVGFASGFPTVTTYVTQPRVGTDGPATADSTLNGTAVTKGTISTANGWISGNTTWPTADTSFVDGSKTFTSSVGLSSGTPNTYSSQSGTVPFTTADGNGNFTLDLYTASAGNSAGSYVYEGFLTINQAADTMTFDPATEATPEPTTFALLGCAGVLVVVMRNKLSRQQA
jgi:hypothetical protein